MQQVTTKDISNILSRTNEVVACLPTHFMKFKLLCILFFLHGNCFSQTISGTVLDTDTQKPLVGAIVYLVAPIATHNIEDTCC